MHLHWHRRDLRVADNRALAEATSDDPALPVFVFDGEVLDHASPPRTAALLAALDSLSESYRECGSDLVVAHGDPREELPRLAEECGADGVRWNRDYSGLARERDRETRQALDDAGLSVTDFQDELLHEPGSILTNAGDHYSVFTYFGKKWLDREKDAPFDAPDSETVADADALPDFATEPLPSLADLGFDAPEAAVPEMGTAAARERLAGFCEDAVFRYDEDRDFPAREGTSRLSVHLKFGTVGIREVWTAIRDAEKRAETDAEREAVESYQRQLAWREFYAHVLDARPDVTVNNYKDYDEPIEWRDDPDGLQAWKDGLTGYPIVDAGMRQLRAEAWMHNRVRMIVASFLAKDLLLDWREGYAWFREKLADHDTANDTGGWQWAASTGTDAQPYFRVFNPTTQGERYDPDAEYIREFIPELRDVPPEKIHDWPDLDPAERDDLAPDYPAPIVDHGERREAAIAMFERARGGD
ncbi:cryptochrome/photolyase family protein [Halorussus amylolyticus]|uniref:cryptochrome/photolyase family protein n=1 Tax=Halorussus amylolyticus TaxID=1126242 RepID=UPI00138F4F65|nr:deoxyribodipyrimidine photo-lyase [Halorussus amylolyticus]